VDVIGGESPRGRTGKTMALGRRVMELRRWARIHRPEIACSHNSYAQIVAAKLVGIPIVTAMDYEHQPANHLAFRLAQKVLLPEAMQSLDLARQGATRGKTRFYPGLKEELYLGGFSHDRSVLDRLGIEDFPGRILVVARTPPSRALYHGSDNELFTEVLRSCAAHPDARVVVLARYAEQRDQLARLRLPNLLLPAEAVDSRSLLYEADLVIGAGGTMTREAALMGVPTYTVFAGRAPAVDARLEREGRLRRLTSVAELPRPRPRQSQPRSLEELHARSRLLLSHFTSQAIGAAT
jgi:hypothetical protein